MLINMDSCFSCFLDVSASTFSPLAAAACFVDASVSAETLIDNDSDNIRNLLGKAEEYHIQKRLLMKRTLETQRLQRHLCKNGLGLGFSVPIGHQGQGVPRPT